MLAKIFKQFLIRYANLVAEKFHHSEEAFPEIGNANAA